MDSLAFGRAAVHARGGDRERLFGSRWALRIRGQERFALPPPIPRTFGIPAEDETKIVDAHFHLWDLAQGRYPWLQGEPMAAFRYGDYGAIRSPYLPGGFTTDSAGQSVVGTVHVEAEWDPADPVAETRWLHEVADAFGIPGAVVGQARLEREDIEAVLAGHAAFPLVRGVRQKPRAAPSSGQVVAGAPASMGDARWRAGYALLAKYGLSYDLQTPYWHLSEAADLARAFPETTIILNHAGLPAERSEAGLAAWREAMQDFADVPNAAVKISGLGVRGRPWTAADNGPIVLDTIAAFGVDRCMFASNYPVDSIVAGYDTIFDGFKEIVRDFPAADRKKLFHDNAVRYYRPLQ